jgi:hypothetical protein
MARMTKVIWAKRATASSTYGDVTGSNYEANHWRFTGISPAL